MWHHQTLLMWHHQTLLMWHHQTLLMWHHQTLLMWHHQTLLMWHHQTLLMWHQETRLNLARHQHPMCRLPQNHPQHLMHPLILICRLHLSCLQRLRPHQHCHRLLVRVHLASLFLCVFALQHRGKTAV
jgi:hypothetical protein